MFMHARLHALRSPMQCKICYIVLQTLSLDAARRPAAARIVMLIADICSTF